jgi:hypothetical protein
MEIKIYDCGLILAYILKIAVESFSKYFFLSVSFSIIRTEKCVILFHCSCNSHSQGFLLNNATLSNISLTNVYLFAVHSCIEQRQCKRESYTSNRDRKAKEKDFPIISKSNSVSALSYAYV